MSALEEAKAALNVADAWRRLGLADKPSKSCRSPFREDRSPSFSVYENGHRWKDHSTGKGGDVADFVATALNVSLSDASKWLLEQTHARTNARSWPKPQRIAPAKPKPPEPRKPLALPEFERATISEMPMPAGIQMAMHTADGDIALDDLVQNTLHVINYKLKTSC